MCGIAGKIRFKGLIDRTTELPKIENTFEMLRHRGPDDQGYYIDERVWLAATRLAILDLSSAGRMPMANEEGNLQMVFNGEIYNYLDLRKKLRGHRFVSRTDSEVVVHLYEDYGIDCLRFLRGMFAFAIWDRKKGQLFLARDRIGKKPLKYFFNSQFFIFASEIKAFINWSEVPRQIDFSAVDEYLSLEYVPSPKTGFEKIYKLPPASYLLVDTGGKVTLRRYWELEYEPKENFSEEEWQSQIINKLKESVRLRLQSDVPLGVHLSGGVDSSLVTAMAARLSRNKIKTFTVGFEDKEVDELPYARLVAERYQTDHREIILKPNSLEDLSLIIRAYEEPFADPSLLPTWALMRESRREITVALNGDGGDENFAGYERYRAMAAFKLISCLPFKEGISEVMAFLYRLFPKKRIQQIIRALKFYRSEYPYFYHNIVSSLDLATKKALYSPTFKKEVRETYQKEYLANKISLNSKNLSWLDQLLSVDVQSYLPDNLMVKVDIASMAHSLEVRSPFLDHELMELVAKMPANLKLKNFQSKYLLKKIAGDFLPRECIYRRKQGFVPPLDLWLRMNKDFLLSELLEDKFLKLNLFNKEILKRMIEKDLFLTGGKSRIIWRLLCLKYWFATWFI